MKVPCVLLAFFFVANIAGNVQPVVSAAPSLLSTLDIPLVLLVPTTTLAPTSTKPPFRSEVRMPTPEMEEFATKRLNRYPAQSTSRT
ncbi:hypothetical protein L596_009259 [Steinernema carpocapsae]|uniref:Secreted protein n=1 Tax=Steinernema carpocapsae TaxID=34508 RepID=A0A4U5PF91_STECR|nr:hypothetical protein L596_009259 [Steinernema carpocapsae]